MKTLVRHWLVLSSTSPELRLQKNTLTDIWQNKMLTTILNDSSCVPALQQKSPHQAQTAGQQPASSQPPQERSQPQPHQQQQAPPPRQLPLSGGQNRRSVLLVGNPALPLKGFDVAIAVLAAVHRVLPISVTWVCQTPPTAAMVPGLASCGALRIALHVSPPQVGALYRLLAGSRTLACVGCPFALHSTVRAVSGPRGKS